MEEKVIRIDKRSTIIGRMTTMMMTRTRSVVELTRRRRMICAWSLRMSNSMSTPNCQRSDVGNVYQVVVQGKSRYAWLQGMACHSYHSSKGMNLLSTLSYHNLLMLQMLCIMTTLPMQVTKENTKTAPMHDHLFLKRSGALYKRKHSILFVKAHSMVSVQCYIHLYHGEKGKMINRLTSEGYKLQWYIFRQHSVKERQ